MRLVRPSTTAEPIRKPRTVGSRMAGGSQPTISFDTTGPFYEMVTTFLAATIGLGPVFDPSNPLALDKNKVALYNGRVQPAFAIDMGQVFGQTSGGGITANEAVNALCCMLINSAYEAVKI